MTTQDIERIEATLMALYTAFRGTPYVPLISLQNDTYTFTRRGSLAMTATAQEIAEQGAAAVVRGI